MSTVARVVSAVVAVRIPPAMDAAAEGKERESGQFHSGLPFILQLLLFLYCKFAFVPRISVSNMLSSYFWQHNVIQVSYV